MSPQSLLATSFLALTACFSLGCSDSYGFLDMTPRTTPPISVSVSNEGITVPVGVAVAIAVSPYDDDGQPMDKEVKVNLVSGDDRVLGVDSALEERSFVIYGAGPGTTAIFVEIDGVRADLIPGTSTLQQTP